MPVNTQEFNCQIKYFKFHLKILRIINPDRTKFFTNP